MANPTIARAAVLRTRDFLGRDVLDAGGNKVGSVKDMLLDRQTGEVHYLEVNLGVFKKQVIIPVRHIDWGEEAFVMRGWSGDQVGRLPPYNTDQPLSGDTIEELVWAYPAFYGSEEDRALGSSLNDPQILPMSEAKDFKVRRDEPDLRGWNVFGADGERVGKVSDLLVDPTAMKVAFLDVDLHDDLFRLKDDRHVLVPTDAVDLRERGQDVWVRGVDASGIARLPAYSGGVVNPLIMRRVSDAFRDVGNDLDSRDSVRRVAAMDRDLDEKDRVVADHPPAIADDDVYYVGEGDERALRDADAPVDEDFRGEGDGRPRPQ